MIIVEGPDGSGKSTLIKNLGFTPLKLRALRSGVGATQADGSCAGLAGVKTSGWAEGLPAIVAYARKIREVQQIPGARIAFDRFHLSEVVFGPLLRGRQDVLDDDLVIINQILRDKQIPVILCLPPREVTLANVMAPGRERPDFQTEAFLIHAYERFERLAPWATHVYDFTRDPLPGFVDHPIVRVNGD